MHIVFIPIKRKGITKSICIDKDDHELFNKYNWCMDKDGYLNSRTYGKYVTLHRLLLGAVRGQEIDHIDRNATNNCRNNLRFCSKQQNQANQKLSKYGSSRYRGVSFCKATNKWAAMIMVNYKCIRLGRFSTQEEAAVAYNKKAKEVFGEFAYQNTI